MPAGARPLRADAARNRDRLLTAAERVFGERGLDAPLEHIAREAHVSVGTLYNHFPTRDALLDAIYPVRLVALQELAARALAEDDAWRGFAGYVEGLLALQAESRGLNDVVAGRAPLSPEVAAACARGFDDAERIVDRARRAGALRADFALGDLVTLSRAMSQVIGWQGAAGQDDWRRCLGFFLDGLRAEAARPHG